MITLRYIPAFLQKYHRLPLPELGCISLERQPSGIHYGEGTLRPPVFRIVFADDQQAVAGDYEEYWQSFLKQVQSEGLLHNSLEELSREIRIAVNRDEVLTIAELIRFYKDDRGVIRFKALNTMLPHEMFGLPELQFFPVSREKPKVGLAAQQTAIPVKKKKYAYTWKTVWASAAVLLLLIGLVSAVHYVNENQFFSAIQVADDRNERLNKRPAELADVSISTPLPQPENKWSELLHYKDAPLQTEEAEVSNRGEGDVHTPVAEQEQAEVNTLFTDTESEPAPEEMLKEDKLSLSPEGPVIFIELLCNPRNVERLLSNIEHSGYWPFSRPRGQCTQVGIYAASVNSDFREALRLIKQQYNADAFLE